MMQTAFQRPAVRRVIGIHRIEHLTRLPGHRGGAG